MQPTDLQVEISTLEKQIMEQEKLLDLALKDDRELGHAKKIFHQIRLLRARLSELINQKAGNSL
jgi:hypothetical protein